MSGLDCVKASVKSVWAGTVMAVAVLVVAGCEIPGADHPALPATPTPAASPAGTRLPPATVTAGTTAPRAPTPAARAVATPAPVTSPEAARVGRVATPSIPGWLAARATRGAGAVATARAEATHAAVVATVFAGATAAASRVVTVHRRSACTTGRGPMRHYASNDVARWTADGAHILLSFNAEVWAVTADGSRVWRLAQAWGQTDPRPVRDFSARFGPMTSFDVTPDGQQVIYATCRYPPAGTRAPLQHLAPFDFDYELAVVGLDGKAPRRLTRHDAFDNYPAWSPDGTRIAFVSGRDVPGQWRHREPGLYTMAADGTDVRHLAPDLEVAWQPPAWSPDGRFIAVAAGSWDVRKEGHALYVVPADGAGLVRLWDAVSGGSWSPDGTRLAFAKPEGAEVALYTIAADGSVARRVTVIHGWQPEYGEPDPRGAWIQTVAWSPDGAKLLYPCGYRQFCVVTLDGQPVSEPCPGRVDGTACYTRGGVVVGTSLVGDRAVWSPDGTRIAVTSRPEGIYPEWRQGEIVLYSAAPDGSDMEPLVRWWGAGGGRGYVYHHYSHYSITGLVAAHAAEEDLATSRAACAGGFVVPAPEANPGLVHDCVTLLAARSALFGELSVNWGSGSPIDLWGGVTVAGAPPRVDGLELAGLDVAGPIPPALGNLDQLRRLDLPGNRLTGPFPGELGQLWNLEQLGLSNNQLTGTIPTELGQLQNLERLGLNNNQLTGTIPASLDQLTHLGELYLADNRLTGCIPAGLKRVPDNDLEELSLPDCEAGA